MHFSQFVKVEIKRILPILVVGRFDTDKLYQVNHNSTNIYLFKVSNRNTRKKCKVFSKLAVNHQNNVIEVVLVFFIVNFEHNSDLFLTFLLFSLNK